MKKLLAVVAMMVLATPAFAAVQNVKVSGSVTSYFVDRSDFDFDTGAEASKYRQNFFYTSTHVLISSDLSDNVSAQVGLANEFVWGDLGGYGSSASTASSTEFSSASHDSSVDLELANVTLREFLYSPLTLTIGRQSFSIGNDFLIGAAGNASVGTMANVANDMSRTQNYDGIQAVLDYKPLTITAFYFKTNSHCLGSGLSNPSGCGGVNGAGVTESPVAGVNKDDADLYGIVANYQLNDPMSTVVEGTFLSSVDNSVNTHLGGKPSTLYVPDLRVSTNPTKDLTIGAEAAGQFGNNYVSGATPDANTKRTKAWAAQASASYNLPVLEKYKPNVTERVSYYSGQGKTADKTNSWSQLYNDQDLGTAIWRSMFVPSDLMISELSFSASPLEDVTAKVTWTDLFLADTIGSSNGGITLNLPDGSTPTAAAKDNRNLGNEIDGVVTYQYTEDVSFGLNVGMFKPGSVFDSKNSTAATQAIVSVGVNF